MITGFPIIRRLLSGVALCLLLAACAKQAAKPKPPIAGMGGTGVPPQLAPRQPDTSPAVASTTAPPSSQVQLTPEEDIIFTDPDNPEASLPELSTLLESAPRQRRGPWEQSESIAKRRAAREGKPVLIWFTDSARSPMCKALAEELLNTPDFNEWASEKIIRLRVDSNHVIDDPDISLEDKETRLVDMKRYVNRLRKQYKVLGNPVMVMCNPGGEVIGRYRGYKRGQADFYWGLIKQGEVASSTTYQAWRSALEKKGYREWQDRQERKVFAKLVSYSDGSLTLVEPDGTRSRTHENKLSDKDRAWIAEQKTNRGL
jgi:thioredoxin-related protein